ncbi:DUF4232 domain-containing protein [Streptomyces nigra]|uniref:DUF4232 domain-containing protein n=1 Tax=Streptomyces nigra TaxID=1827580 RepID=UPI0035D6CEE4
MGRAPQSPFSVRGRRAALPVTAAALLCLLAACADGTGASDTGPTRTPSPGGGATTAPGRDDGTGPATTAPTTTPGTPDTESPVTQSGAAAPRCHTSELRARLGRPSPGAGQRNFPIVLTNRADRTCTVRGYPGAAFVDASGRQLGPDPRRSPDTPATVSLAPGASAWAGLTFASPEISGARTAEPKELLVTPPDERDPLRVAWTSGEVPVGGNESTVFLTVLQPGTGG